MKTGPRYKICRRLGSSVYTKCQTPKYALSEERRGRPRRRPRSRSNYAVQLLEKQRARFTYGVSERQFGRYVKESLTKPGSPSDNLYQRLEERLDNVVFRLGYAASRRMARQLVSHGHFQVNGKRLTVPSHQIKIGDVVSLRARSQEMPFASIKDAPVSTPSWLDKNADKHEASVTGRPKYDQTEQPFELTKVVEFYSR